MNYDKVKQRAIELCELEGLDPYFWTTIGNDNFGEIKEQNWELWKEQAESELEDNDNED